MNRKRLFAAATAVLAAVLVAIPVVGHSVREGTGVDYEALAQKLVTQSANVHEGDRVLVYGGVRDSELLENIAVHVRKLGAFPLITIGSDRMTRRMYDDVPAEYDSQTPEFELGLAGLVDVIISVDYGETEGLLADVPPERLTAAAQAYQPVSDLQLERNVRQVYLGNGLYPTEALAARFGVPQEELAEIFWNGVNADYEVLHATAEAVRATVAAGAEVRITSPSGTDLRASIEGRPVLASDGVISADEMDRGGAACLVWLPAGEVYLAPVPGTAQGTVVVDRQFFQGDEIRGLTLTFEAGRLTSMTAEAGLERLRALYDAAAEGKDVFACIDIGVNPEVHVPPGSRMVAWMPAGMITVGVGSNLWAGGENDVGYFMTCHLPDSTLEVDGEVLVDGGVLKP